MSELWADIVRGRPAWGDDRVAALGLLVERFDGLDERQRRALVPAFKDLATAQRALKDWSTQEWQGECLRVIGAACLGSAAALAPVLGRRDVTSDCVPFVVDVLVRREVDWVPDLVERLAQRVPALGMSPVWELVDAVARRFELPPPPGDGYVLGWLQAHLAYRGERALVERLAQDPFFPAIVPRLFQTPGVGAVLRFGQRNDMAAALASLVPRADLIDGCVSRLVRGEQVDSLRGFVALYEEVAPTVDEVAPHTASLLRLLPDAHTTVAAMAQSALRRLDDAGRLSVDDVVEASRAVLFRPDRKLARTQFTWLTRAVKRHPDHAAVLLAAAAAAFGHFVVAVQEDAVALIAKHLPALPADQADVVRDEVRANLDLVSELVRPEAAALVGEVAESAPAPDALFAPAPRELPPPIADVDELVQETAVLLAASTVDPLTLERVLAGLVRLRPEPAALAPVVPHEWDDSASHVVGLVGYAIACAAGRVPTPHGSREVGSPQAVLAARVREIAHRLRDPNPAPYLAEPVTATGYVEPAGLVAALHACEARGWEPGELDLEHALLRLPSTIDAAIVASAATLRSPWGRRAAKVLADGGFPHPTTSRMSFWQPALAAYRAHVAASDDSPVLAALAGPSVDREEGMWGLDIACWPMLLPRHRDVIAAHATASLLICARQTRGAGVVLPLLAESDGPAGDGMALAFAYGLSARHAVDRVAAVDGFVTLAARGDAVAIGAAIGDLAEYGLIKANRIADALAEAAKAGANAAVWEVARPALPSLLRGKGASGVADLLGVAAEAAVRVGARGTVDGLDAHADRHGSTRVSVEARRLRKVLTA